jgi:glycyl-tRNA synthetase
MTTKKTNTTMEAIVSLAKRRGFVFPFGGFYDYGPLGVQLKRNIEATWWKAFVEERDDVVGLSSSIIMHPDVWKASGHLEN